MTARKRRGKSSRSLTLVELHQRFKAGLGRQWKVARNGTPYKLGGWWEITKCKKCGEPRYAYARVGTIFANVIGSDVIYNRRAFPAKSIGSNEFMDSLMPTEASKPYLSCLCSVEP